MQNSTIQTDNKVKDALQFAAILFAIATTFAAILMTWQSVVMDGNTIF